MYTYLLRDYPTLSVHPLLITFFVEHVNKSLPNKPPEFPSHPNPPYTSCHPLRYTSRASLLDGAPPPRHPHQHNSATPQEGGSATVPAILRQNTYGTWPPQVSRTGIGTPICTSAMSRSASNTLMPLRPPHTNRAPAQRVLARCGP